LNKAYFLIPGDPDRRTGGTIYDRRIMAGLTALDWKVTLQCLDATFPAPTRAAQAGAHDALAELPQGALAIIDGLALGAMPEVATAHRNRLRLVGLVHHPLALETGLDEPQRQRLYASEREALRQVRQVIVTSPSTARALMRYDVAPERCAVILPGVDPAPLATGSRGDELTFLCVASLTPRKGHAVLLRALAWLGDRPWRLRCAGSDAHDPATAAGLRILADELDCSNQIEWLGELEAAALDAAYQQTDGFVLPSFHEGYGMALAEALARFLDEPSLRERLASGARTARQTLPDWPTASARFAEVLEAVRAQ